jgi:hypothetical protein
MPQTKADRQAAAKKGAATRQRNRTRAESRERGTKAAATAQGNRASASVDTAKQSAGSAVGGGLGARRPRRGPRLAAHGGESRHPRLFHILVPKVKKQVDAAPKFREKLKRRWARRSRA